jgi:hypothetical protein
MTRTLQSRPEGCVSDLMLDRLLAGECSDEEARSANTHIEGCDGCRGRLETFGGDRDTFASRELPLPGVARKRLRRPPLAVWGIGGAVVAMAAAVLLLVRPKAQDGIGESTRLKGPSHIGFYVKHGSSVSRGSDGQRVEPGDALRFTYSSGAPRYVAVLSVDGARHASVYFPDAAIAERVEPAIDRALPSSTVLDATLGEEHLYGLVCLDPVALEPLRRALENAPDRALMAEGCDVDMLTIRKELPAAP